jgi:hypothetical protein
MDAIKTCPTCGKPLSPHALENVYHFNRRAHCGRACAVRTIVRKRIGTKAAKRVRVNAFALTIDIAKQDLPDFYALGWQIRGIAGPDIIIAWDKCRPAIVPTLVREAAE